MRDMFPGFYRPSDKEFNEMWSEGIVSVDANILLHIYRYSSRLRDTLFELFNRLGDRLWIPNRVAFEFSKNRLKVISSQEKAYDEATAVLEKIARVIKSEFPARHPFIETDEIKRSVIDLVAEKTKLLSDQKEKHPKVLPEDLLLERLLPILAGKIGLSDTSEQDNPKFLEDGEREGSRRRYRLAFETPPRMMTLCNATVISLSGVKCCTVRRRKAQSTSSSQRTTVRTIGGGKVRTV